MVSLVVLNAVSDMTYVRYIIGRYLPQSPAIASINEYNGHDTFIC